MPGHCFHAPTASKKEVGAWASRRHRRHPLSHQSAFKVPQLLHPVLTVLGGGNVPEVFCPHKASYSNFGTKHITDVQSSSTPAPLVRGLDPRVRLPGRLIADVVSTHLRETSPLGTGCGTSTKHHSPISRHFTFHKTCRFNSTTGDPALNTHWEGLTTPAAFLRWRTQQHRRRGNPRRGSAVMALSITTHTPGVTNGPPHAQSRLSAQHRHPFHKASTTRREYNCLTRQ
jgi:hypothetical protein